VSDITPENVGTNKPTATRFALPDRKFLIWLIVASVLLAAIPFIVGTLSAPAGSSYIGYQFGTDDQMVYSAWMHQAMHGRFLFDNRFTTDPQPSLTIHLYFLLLGWIAKVVGLSLAATLGRLVFSGLFVVLLYRLVLRLGWEPTTTKLAAVFAVFGGGIGFLVWHTFGVAIVKDSVPLVSSLTGGRLPTDVWQPEGFVFPSMLINGLFMVSLCLILVIVQSILDAKESWKPVLPGALSLAVLVNIHSYDVLLVALVMVGFLATAIARRQFSVEWLIRVGVMVCGAIPPAAWFVYVLKSDKVFQARAATDTPSANFQAVLFGYILLMILALTGLALRPTEDEELRKRRFAGVGLAALLLLGLYIAGGAAKSQYMLDSGGWVLSFLVALGATFLLADDNPAVNLLISWALIGTAAIYFPGLFQRKLAEGLSIPWAILAAYGLVALVRKQEGTVRLLVTSLACILLCATSVRWLARDIFQLILRDTSNTSMQTVYLDKDTLAIVEFLNHLKGRHVLIAPDGQQALSFRNHTEEDSAETTPLIPDLNPIMSGITGIYTYAGHWSETPEYPKKRAILDAIFFDSRPTIDQRLSLIKTTGADYIIVLIPESAPIQGLPDLRSLGDVVVAGKKLALVHVR